MPDVSSPLHYPMTQPNLPSYTNVDHGYISPRSQADARPQTSGKYQNTPMYEEMPPEPSSLAEKLKRGLLVFEKGEQSFADTSDDESRVMLKLRGLPSSLDIRHNSVVRSQDKWNDFAHITGANYEDIGRATNELPHIAYNYNISRIAVTTVFIIAHFIVFTLLMLFRTFPQISRAVAKNSAVLTLVDLTCLVATMGYTSTVKRTILHTLHVWSGVMLVLWSLVHTVGHIYLLYEFSAFLFDHLRYFYTSVFPYEYTSGVIMLLALLVVICMSINPVRKHKYDSFYFTHIVGWTLFSLLAGFHSYYLLAPIGITAITLYAKRILNRVCLKPCVSVRYYGNKFVLLNLRIRDTWLTRWLLLNFLRNNQGNAVVWISSAMLDGCSRFERHPFTVIEIDQHQRNPNYAFITLMISRSGNWKQSLHSLLSRNMNRELYSLGVRLMIDSARVGEFTDSSMLKSVNLLFLLENVGIASFLAFIRFLCDPKHREKLHVHERVLHLHYRVDDLEYLTVLATYLDIVSSFKFVKVEPTIYTSMPFTFRNQATVVSSRLNYRRILPKFLLTSGKHYIYMNDQVMVQRINRELNNIKKSKQRKIKPITVNL